MAKLIELDLSPDDAKLRQFGWIALVGFGLVAALAYTESLVFASFPLGENRVPVAGALAGLGVLSALIGLVWPRGNWPIYVGLSLLAFPIGFVLSWVILGTLYFLIITPTGLVMRAIGHDPLQRRFEPDAETYWSDARPTRPRDSYFRQY